MQLKTGPSVVFLFLGCLTLAALSASPVAANDFATWIKALRKEALDKGISTVTLDTALRGLKLIPRVIELDRRQPEFTLTFEQYMSRVVSKGRIDKAIARAAKHREILARVSAKYGVQERFIVALWGIESDFGRLTGGFDVIPALATLAFDGRRSAFFRAQLLNALEIVDQGHIKSNAMRGSWAGAMGQVQFMPSSFLRFAVDFDGDGRKDLWGTPSDIFASAANYLAKSGWNGTRTWGRRVALPTAFDTGFLGLKVKKTLKEWHGIGITRVDGRALPDIDITASVIRPKRQTAKSFLVYGNYRTILKWNRSHYFALAVGHLADAIGRKYDGIYCNFRVLPHNMMCFQFRVTLRIALLGLFAGGFLSACAEGEFIAHATKEIQGRLGPKERGQTTYKIGNPYEINGVWYYPKVDYEFNESGIASWYGSKFHGKKTANGEIFDMNRVSAAHRTLPLPSVVRVTNLRNGRAINVRLNDRGPYAHGRIIDLSRRGAQLLGFERQGTAPVRVQVLAEESRQIAMKLHGRTARRAAEPTKPKADPTVSVTSQKIAPPPGTKSKAPPSKNFEVKAVATAPEKGGRSKANLAEVDETVTVVKVDKAPRIFVQAGAFARYQNAHKVRAILKQLGPTKISQVDRNQHPLFRVRIGPVKTIQQADNILASVIRAGYRDARTVID